jgi:hypothetical protein
LGWIIEDNRPMMSSTIRQPRCRRLQLLIWLASDWRGST